MRIILIIMLLPFVTVAQKKIRISVPDGTSIDSTVLIGGYGIDAVESPANTWNIVADTSQLVTQYDITNKQDKLISGTNIKTVNGNTLLGSGNLSVGTVTSVGATGGTGISVSPSSITSSGTFTITNTQPHQATNLSLSQVGSVVTLGSSTGTGVTLTAGTNVGFSTAGNNTTINVTGGGGGGTVTSVAIANGGGISVSGSPITTSGTITLTAADLSNTNEIQTLSYNSGTRDLSISSGNTVTIPYVGTANGGLVSALPLTNQTSVFLRGDNTWATPPGGGSLTGSGINQQVTYWTGTNSIAGSSAFLWDNSNSRLILGAPTTPSRTLDVNGAVRFRSLIADANNSTGTTGQYLTSNGIGAWFWSDNPIQSHGSIDNVSATPTAITTSATKINFTNSLVNGGITSDITTANEKLTVSASGNYEISFNSIITGAANRVVTFQINKNNSVTDYAIVQSKPANDNQTICSSWIVSLNANDFIDIRVFYGTGTGTGTDINYSYPFLKIKRLK